MGNGITIVAKFLGKGDGLLNTIRQLRGAFGQYGVTIVQVGKQADASSAGLNKLTTSARTTASVIRQVFGTIQQATSSLGGGFGAILSSFTNLATRAGVAVFAIKQLASTAVSFGQALISPNANIERITVAFEGLLGSAQAAQTFLAQLTAFAQRTPFTLPGLQDAAQRLLAFRFAASDIIPLLTTIGDTVAGLGGGAAEIDRLTTALGQMQARGRISTEELLQLTELGIPAFSILADKMGISTGKLQDMVSRGLVPTRDALPALIAGLNEAFGGQMQRQSQTLSGIVSNISDRFLQLRTIFGQPIFELVRAQLAKFLQALSSPEWASRAALLGTLVARGLEQAGAAFRALLTVASRIGQAISAVLSGVGGSLGGFVGVVLAAFAPLGAALQALLRGDFQTAISMTRQFLSNLGAVIVSVLSGFAGQLFSGGVNVIASFANGLISGGSRFVRRALDYVTGMIASFLRGYSPPKAGPLRTIDTWFPKVIDAYLGSWTEADWGALTSVTDRIASYFEGLVSDKKIAAVDAIQLVSGHDNVAGLNELIAQVIDGINATGKIEADAFLQIQNLLGSQHADLFKELQARFSAAAANREVTRLQSQLRQLDDPEARRALDDAIDAAEEQIRTARSAREQRAGRERLAAAKAAQKSLDAQKTTLERQLEAAQRVQQTIEDQIAGHEAIVRLRERELQFAERILKIEREPIEDAEAEAKKRAEAEFRYNVAVADTAGKLALYQQRLSGLEQGSEDYFSTLTEVKQLEGQLADERERAAKEAEDAAKRRADAAWNYSYALANNASRLEMLKSKLGDVEQGSEDYYSLQTQIHEVERAINREREEAAEKAERAAKDAEEAAKRRADAEWEYRYATAKDGTERLALLNERLGKTDPESEEGFKLRAQIAQEESQIAEARLREEKERFEAIERRTRAEQDYLFAIADDQEKLRILQARFDNLKDKDSEEGFELRTEIAQREAAQREKAEQKLKRLSDAQFELDLARASTTEEKLALLEKRRSGMAATDEEYLDLTRQIIALEEEQQQEAERREEAAWEYNYAIADSDQKLVLLRGRLSEVEEGSAEWYDIQLQIKQLEEEQERERQQAADEAARREKERADALFDYQMSIGTTAEKLALLEEKLSSLPVGSAEYYDTLQQIDALQQQQADEQQRLADEEAQRNKERADALFDYQMGVGTTAQKIALLKDKLAGLTVGSAEYYQVLGQIKALESQQADEQKRLADQEADAQKRRNDAAFEYSLHIADNEGKLRLLKQRLSELKEGDEEWYRVKAQIFDIEQQINRERDASAGADRGGVGPLFDPAASGPLEPLGDPFAAVNESIEHFKAQIEEGKAKLGEIRTQADAALTGVGQKFDELVGKVRPVVGIVGAVATAFGVFMAGRAIDAGIVSLTARVATWIATLRGAPTVLGGLATLLGGPVTLAVTALIVAGGLLVTAWVTNFGNIQGRTQQFVDWWNRTVMPLWDRFYGVVRPIFENVGTLVTTGLVPAFQTLWDNIAVALTFLQPTWEAFKGTLDSLAPIVAAVVGYFIGFAGIIQNVLMIQLNLAINLLSGILPGVFVALGGVITVFLGIVRTIADVITGVVGIVVATVQGFLTGDWQPLWQAANDFLNAIFRDVIQVALGFVQILGGIVGGIVVGVIAAFKGLWTDAGNLVRSIVDTIIGFFQGLYDDMVGHSIIPDLVNGVVGWFKDLKDRAVQFVKDMIGAYTSGGGGILGLAWFLQDKFVAGVTNLVGSYGSSGGGVLGLIWQLQDRVIGGFKTLVGAYTSGGGGALGFLFLLVDTALDVVRKWVGADPNAGLEGIIKAGLENIRLKWENFIGDYAPGKKGVLGWVYHLVDTVLDKVRVWVGAGANDGLEGIVKAGLENVRQKWEDFIGDYSPGKKGVLGWAFFLIDSVLDKVRTWVGAGENDGIEGIVKKGLANAQQKFVDFIGEYKPEKGGVLGLLHGLVTAGTGAIGDLIGDYGAEKGGVLGGLFSLKTTFEAKATELKNAFLKPFTDARDEIGGIVKAFANNIIGAMDGSTGGLNGVLSKLESWLDKFRQLVNWLAQQLGLSDPFPNPYTLQRIPQFARGTNFAPGGPALVGEEGPEIVYIPRGSKVKTAAQTRRLLARGEGPEDGDVAAPVQSRSIFSRGLQWLFDQALSLFDINLSLPGILGNFAGALFTRIKDGAFAFVQKLWDSVATIIGGNGGGADGAWSQMVGNGWTITQTFANPPGHGGVDIAIAEGTPINTIVDAVVAQRGYVAELEGNYSVLQDEAGRYYYYGHQRDYPLHAVGTSLRRGTKIGFVGMTGAASGPHVHFETWLPDGTKIDPYEALRQYARGGVIREPVAGYGLHSGDSYLFGEDGDEVVIPLDGFSDDDADAAPSTLFGLMRTVRDTVADALRLSADTSDLLNEMVAELQTTLTQRGGLFSFDSADMMRDAFESMLYGDTDEDGVDPTMLRMFAPQLTINGSNLSQAELEAVCNRVMERWWRDFAQESYRTRKRYDQ